MAQARPRLTLVQLFVIGTFGVLVMATGALIALVSVSRREIIDQSDAVRDAQTQRFATRISSELGVAGDALEDMERSIRSGAVSVTDGPDLEAGLFAELANRPTLSDITFTHARLRGFGPKGDARLLPHDRWQLSVYRKRADADSAIVTRRTTEDGDHFATFVRDRLPGEGFDAQSFEAAPDAPDPTTHLTFETSASKSFHGQAIWSDLHYSELDAALPKDAWRLVVTVQKAIDDGNGRFVGVLRVGLLTSTIDESPRSIERELVPEAGPNARVFLCDRGGRLVARPSGDDEIGEIGDDLRVVAGELGPTLEAALASPALEKVEHGEPSSDLIVVGGERLRVTFRALEHTQDWIVGVVVPESFYMRDLSALKQRVELAYGGLALLVLVAGGLALRQLRRGLGSIVGATARMRALDFAPEPVASPFRDVGEVMDELERAKTSMRALGKYAPMDLVRDLYRENREPTLGGELREVSVMFSDIEGFTSLSEQLEPSVLAQALGRYLEAMIAGVQSTGGTVDKFIGDAVMAFWNAPGLLDDHPRRACAAVLACQKAAGELYASDDWKDLPPLFTRFGLHTAKVMVGHFGAPERLAYTVLGDGVNLAARLESLCKQYGVAVLASESVVGRVGDEFAFRLVDKVAVKGKSEAVRVYELLDPETDHAAARTYESAFEAYLARDFQRAVELLEPLDDAPGRVLARRCRQMQADPPADDWNGVFVAEHK